MAGEPGRRRSFWGAVFAIIGGAFRLAFAAVGAWWRWAGQRQTTRGKVLAYGGPITAVVVLIIIIAAASAGGGGDNGDGEQVAGEPTQAEQAAEAPTEPPQPTDTPRPPEPTDTPLPPTPTPEPVVLSGVGQTATDPVQLPSPISVATLTHEGSGNFAVWLYQDGQRLDLLVNEIGWFQGRRPLMRDVDPDRPVVFDIEADGPWTIRLDPLGFTGSAAFSGRGADVSGLFDPPQSGPWEFSHDGQSNFAVWLHCLGGSDLIQNEIGPVSGSRIVEFAEGPCFWEVEADGSWSLTPR